MRQFHLLLKWTAALILFTSFSALAAIVGPGGYTNAFSTQPPAADWATYSVSGGGSDNFDMDTDVNTLTSTLVSSQTSANANDPAAQLATATWSSSGLYLQTRPTGNRYTVLMGKFINNTGTNATQVTMACRFSIVGTASAEDSGKGTRGYFSLSGNAGSWANLSNLNTTATSGTTNLLLSLAVNWTNGGSFFFLWADDNGAAGTDVGCQVDDFALLVTAGSPPSLGCTVTAPSNNAVLSSSGSVSATAAVAFGTPPYSVEYFTNSGTGGPFVSAGSSATAPYSINLGGLRAGTWNIYAVVTDSSGTPVTSISPTNSFLVANPIELVLTAPVDGTTVDYTTPVTGTATIDGGTPPYSLQFFLDNVTNGPAITTPPYSRSFGALPVGDHLIKATVRDSKGWTSNSLASILHVSGPLAVTLNPTNGASYSFGTSVNLSAIAGGGTAPYTVSFVTNGQLAGVSSTQPFSMNLGLLPPGSYTCLVYAVDASLPVQTAYSTTNVIQILTNSLTATLTAPSSGQLVGTNVNFAISVSAAVGSPVIISSVDFYYDGALLGSDTTAPYSLVVSNRVLGSHSVYAVVTDSLGRSKSTVTNSMTFIVDPLANDNFANRLTLNGPVAGVTASNVGATTESGEPTGSGFTTWGATLWWRWVAPASGTVIIDTTGSSFNIGQGVYTGNSVNSLTQIAFAGNSFGSTVNQVTFTAQAGTEYQIQIAGMRGFGPGGGTAAATGSILFSIQMPPSVAITAPSNNSTFIAGSNILITANASAVIGGVREVDFYTVSASTATYIGRSTNAPYSFLVTNAPLGTNVLYAVAVDDAGQYTVSSGITVLVLNTGLTIVLPADGSTYQSTRPITVSALGFLPAGAITNVEFFVNGQKFAEDATVPFTVAWSNVVSGSHRLTAVGKSDAGVTYNSQPVNIAVARALVASNSVWKFLDTGVDQGTNWIAPSFGDSSWGSGPAPLGFSDSNGRLPLTTNSYGPDANNKYPTTYYRQAFVVSNLAAYSAFQLNIQRDDGAIVYLNGVEAGRFNMPSGFVGYTNFAAANASDDGATTFSASINAALLHEGTNVFAVEIHQDSASSSDIWFVMELLGIPPIIRNQYPAVAFVSPPSGASFHAPANVVLEASASDSDGHIVRVEFFLDNVKVGESANPPFSAALNDLPPGNYTITAVATDNQNASTSASTTIHVYQPISRWVAFNDHYAGPATSPHATAWNPFGTDDGAPGDEGALRNIETGANLQANLTIIQLGAFGDSAAGAPLPGTPAYNTFNGAVDFGSGGASHSILVDEDSIVMHLFTGLDPARRYAVRGTAMGGIAAYSNRWTHFTLVGANSARAAHTANVLTSATQPALSGNEAAMNTGDNRTGDMVGWDDIAPGADGSFALLSSQYLGAAPGNARPGPVAYAPVAIRLEELSAIPLAIITAPAQDLVLTGPTNIVVAASANAVVGITNVLFLANGNPIGTATAPPYSALFTNAPFGSNTFVAVAYDSQGSAGTSAPVSMLLITPPTNTIPPLIFSQLPVAGATITNFTSLQVTFTAAVGGVDASDLLVNDVPALAVSGGGSNYTFTFAQPAYGPVRVRFVTGHGITDFSWPNRLVFYENEPGASWDYLLVDRTPPAVAAKIPAAGANLTNLSQITVTFTEPASGVDASDLLVNGTAAFAVNGSGATYTFSVSQPPSGTVTISWAANHNIYDLAAVPNLFNRLGANATWTYNLDAKTILVDSNSFWLFAKGTNEASLPTNAWRQLAFNDSAWSNAPAPFFYGDPYSNGVPAYTLLSDMRSNYSSIYLRKAFVVPNAGALTNLYLRAQIDDGMVVWINGVEVLRTNAPAGEVPYSGVATATSSEPNNNGAAYITFQLPDPAAYLVSGSNVIAVHALNESLSASSDFGFNAQLFTYQADTEVVAPRLVGRDPLPGYTLFLTNITVRFSEPVKNVDAADLLVNGVPATHVANVSNTVFTFGFPQPPYGAVNVTWAANHGIVDFDLNPKPFDAASAASIWQYTLLNPFSPYLLDVAPVQGSTINHLSQINILFSEPVIGVDASDLLLNGIPATSVVGSGLAYTFAFPQPAYGPVAVTWTANHGIVDLNVPPELFDTSWPNHTWIYTLVDQTAPAIATVSPAAGSAVIDLTQLTVTFTEPVTGVDAGDLLVNGKPATTVTGTNSTYTFGFPQPNASVVAITWIGNSGIRDLAATPNLFNPSSPGATWFYSANDNVAPSISAAKPAPYLIVKSLSQISLSFDEPVAGVDASDLRINGAPASQVFGTGAGPYLFQFAQPATGQVQITWAPGHGIHDLAAPPNAFAGNGWTYVLNPNIASDFAVKHIVHISLDGVGAYYLENYINNAPAQFPNFVRLTREGAWTLNARTDYDISVTLPNHTSMLTGRPVLQPNGWDNTTYHGLTVDSDNGTSVQDPRTGNPNVPYKASVFDVVHDRGLPTAFICSKQSLMLVARGWDATHGAADLVGNDDGSNKIDNVYFATTTPGSYGPSSLIADQFVNRVATNDLWSFTFMHYDDGDANGHASGWGSVAYSNGLMNADLQIGRVLNAITANPDLSNSTIVIITADHGGSGSGHSDATGILMYRIPLFVWGAGIPAGVDLYSLFSNRADPGTSRPSYSTTAVLQPLRNGDVGNLATTLLGLPLIPGSSMAPVFRGDTVTLFVAQTPSGITVSWPATLQGAELLWSTNFGPAASWRVITNGINSDGVRYQYRATPSAQDPVGFFRLRKP